MNRLDKRNKNKIIAFSRLNKKQLNSRYLKRISKKVLNIFLHIKMIKNKLITINNREPKLNNKDANNNLFNKIDNK